jgi:hypothetical protein
MIDDTKRLVIGTALRKLFSDKHFSICAVDRICEVLGCSRGGDAYRQLHALHCVDYADMPRELAERIPALVAQAIGNVNVLELARLSEPAEARPGATTVRSAVRLLR